MSREPTFESSAIRRQFSELANLIDDDLTVYLIGGGALTLEGLKNATKDIDLIVREESELRQLWNVLTSAGYKPKEDLGEEYDELGAAFILEKDHRRFDVFHEQVAGVISLSDSMVSRSRHLFEEDGLSVRMVSLNDIFLFKAVANREDDVEDMVRIAQAGIEDDVVVEEIMSQLDLLGSDDFIGAMKQKLERLEDRGFVFDIHDEVNDSTIEAKMDQKSGTPLFRFVSTSTMTISTQVFRSPLLSDNLGRKPPPQGSSGCCGLAIYIVNRMAR
ncbi:nucleotidyltransferase [Halorubrum ezzemoulense]|uniref:nucleotidyltransferase n=1 Tax=Halorubrum ezzemoulense TaxID=337243 RepID=UPI00232E2B26|nr:nucleotidyltransferase [Halorubrum ezzemoulense]MDB2283615.1 nucleotidyltransferase [Halorubrum ezzemoulense]